LSYPKPSRLFLTQSLGPIVVNAPFFLSPPPVARKSFSDLLELSLETVLTENAFSGVEHSPSKRSFPLVPFSASKRFTSFPPIQGTFHGMRTPLGARVCPSLRPRKPTTVPLLPPCFPENCSPSNSFCHLPGKPPPRLPTRHVIFIFFNPLFLPPFGDRSSRSPPPSLRSPKLRLVCAPLSP